MSLEQLASYRLRYTALHLAEFCRVIETLHNRGVQTKETAILLASIESSIPLPLAKFMDHVGVITKVLHAAKDGGKLNDFEFAQLKGLLMSARDRFPSPSTGMLDSPPTS